MMKLIEKKKGRNGRAGIPAVAGGVFLFVLLCGCGYGRSEEMLYIGSAVQEADAAADEREAAESGVTLGSGTKPDGGTAGNGVPKGGGTAENGMQGSGAAVQEAGVRESGGAVSEGGTQESGTAESGQAAAQTASVRVYVCGAVMCPGVVDIPEGSRAEDALLAAGGFSPDAGREALNLADWVTDGQMLYFPTEKEAAEWKNQGYTAQSGSPAGGSQGTGTTQNPASGLVNINTADKALLCTLPGIGESRAADIIAYREKNGSFETCGDVMKVSGIKTSVYEKIRDKITVR